jgi:tetratricopeptide (TPR) repeat protein
MATTNSVFISYRREMGGVWALALYQQLTSRGIDAFYDIESIRELGQFNTKLLSQIAARPYFLLVLTPGTLARCVQADDWLRREIEHAVANERVVVPLFTPQFDFADVDAFLPSPLAKVVRESSGLELNPTWFKEAIVRLTEELLVPVSSEVRPMSAEADEHIRAAIEAAEQAPTVTQERLKAQEHLEKAYERPATALDERIADYTEAIRLDPDNAIAFYQRGLAREMSGDHEGAAADLQEAGRLDPALVDPRLRPSLTTLAPSVQTGSRSPLPPPPPPPPVDSRGSASPQTGMPAAGPSLLIGADRRRRRQRSMLIVVISAALVTGLVLLAVALLGDDGGQDESATSTAVPNDTSKSTEAPSTTSGSGPPTVPVDRLPPNGILRAGQSIVSSNGRHVLRMTAEGELIATTDGREFWRAPYRFAPTPGSIAVMQEDGNFVVYASDPPAAGTSPWDSKTKKKANEGASLVIEDVHGQGRVAIVTSNATEVWWEPQPKATSPGTAETTPTTAGPTLVTVPNVVGMSESQARDALESADLKPRVERTDVPFGSPQVDVVVEQDPPAGDETDSGSTVTIELGVASAPATTTPGTAPPPT